MVMYCVVAPLSTLQYPHPCPVYAQDYFLSILYSEVVMSPKSSFTQDIFDPSTKYNSVVDKGGIPKQMSVKEACI